MTGDAHLKLCFGPPTDMKACSVEDTVGSCLTQRFLRTNHKLIYPAVQGQVDFPSFPVLWTFKQGTGKWEWALISSDYAWFLCLLIWVRLPGLERNVSLQADTVFSICLAAEVCVWKLAYPTKGKLLCSLLSLVPPLPCGFWGQMQPSTWERSPPPS